MLTQARNSIPDFSNENEPVSQSGSMREALAAARENLWPRAQNCLLLLSELYRTPKAIGAVCSSSQRLANRMAAWIDPLQEGLVIELGGGTGAITSALLTHGVAPDKLIVIEQSARLASHLSHRFPSVRIAHSDAADIDMILNQAGGWTTLTTQAVLPHHHSYSSATDAFSVQLTLPLAGCPEDFPLQVVNIATTASETAPFTMLRSVTGAQREMPVKAVVSSLPLRSLPMDAVDEITNACVRTLSEYSRVIQFTYAPNKASPWVKAGLKQVASETVWTNIPPAWVEIFACP